VSVTWQALIGEEKEQAYFTELLAFVEKERNDGKIVYPPSADVFNAFKLCSADNCKVVILGQDPYHGPNQAHGLSFSVKKGNKIPPSLRNIYKELSQDIDGFVIPSHGELTGWAQQGVLLLNTVLTVRDSEAHSHKNKGWERFTDRVIQALSEHDDALVFLLWGAPAQKKSTLIDTNKHFILSAPHPSPLSAHRGFLGCRHFSQTNELLISAGKVPINWQIEP
jgi:uracil-DNA glycosylase